jgi:hypothetical protein
MSSGSDADDRELQDRIIRYLTDPGQRAETADLQLAPEEAEKAKRFSKFLVRRYYRDRLSRGFRYSRSILAALLQTPTRNFNPQANGAIFAEDVVDSLAFDDLLSHCVLGSLSSARSAGELALAQLKPLATSPWWDDLLQYEFAFFIQLATSELAAPPALPALSANTIVQAFRWKMPELLAHLKSGGPVTPDLRGDVTLLFSRTHHGRIYVVELDERALALISAMDGTRTVEEIVTSTGIGIAETTNLLGTLRDIGAMR